MKNYPKQAKVFQALAHPVRLQLLEALSHRPLCVCELVALTGRRQANISQHLTLLRQIGLVSCERTGWNVFYRVNVARLEGMLQFLRLFCSAAKMENPATQQSEAKPQGCQILLSECQWHPVVILERCVGCGLCATACENGVFAFDYENNRPVVLMPEYCVAGCTTCATMCAEDAIELPSADYIRQWIHERNILSQTIDILRENRALYDLKVRRFERVQECS